MSNEFRGAKKVQHGIWYNEKADTYYVNAGKMKVYAFPTLNDAMDFRDTINAEKLAYKKAEAIAAIREKEDKELAKTYPYPFNAMKVMGIENEDPELFDEFLTKECTYKEIDCISAYFHKEMTLEQIGNAYGVGMERIRQIVAKGLMRIKYRYFRYPKEQERQAKQKRYEDEMRHLNQHRAELVRLFKEKGVYTEEMEIEFGKPMVKRENQLIGGVDPTLPIDELDFSVRTANCLKRAGVKNIYELTTKTADQVRWVRNLGKKGFKEVEHKLSVMGLSFAD